MIKRLFSNPSVLFLLLGNIYCIWYYERYPEDFGTIVWIYWFQSVIIGFFNFLELLTTKKENSDLKMNNKPGTNFTSGCAAWFFLFHFGMFHLVYSVFLLVQFDVSLISKSVLLIGIATFFIESLIGFMRHKQAAKTEKVSTGLLFFLPYVRIIPMHLMILLPAFFGVTPSLLFLLLKMGADLLSFRLYNFVYRSDKSGNAVY